MKLAHYTIAAVCMIASVPSAAQTANEMPSKIKEFNETINSRLTACEFKVVWDSLRELGYIDDEKFGMNVASKCGFLLVRANEMIGPQVLIAHTMKNLSFARKKISKDGNMSFQIYDYFDYSGEAKQQK